MYSASKFLLAIALASTTGWAYAQKKLSKPTGPITITAKNAEWQEGIMIYTGEVMMVSSTMNLRGARLEMRQIGGTKGPYEITITGAPASFHQDGETSADPAVDAHAQKIVYRSASQDIDLTQAAQLTRGKNEINGDSVHYNVAQRRVQASGGEQGQVKIVIDAPEAEAQLQGDSKPPPPPTGAPASPPPTAVPLIKPTVETPKAAAKSNGKQP